MLLSVYFFINRISNSTGWHIESESKGYMASTSCFTKLWPVCGLWELVFGLVVWCCHGAVSGIWRCGSSVPQSQQQAREARSGALTTAGIWASMWVYCCGYDPSVCHMISYSGCWGCGLLCCVVFCVWWLCVLCWWGDIRGEPQAWHCDVMMWARQD